MPARAFCERTICFLADMIFRQTNNKPYSHAFAPALGRAKGMPCGRLSVFLAAARLDRALALKKKPGMMQAARQASRVGVRQSHAQLFIHSCQPFTRKNTAFIFALRRDEGIQLKGL